MTAPMNRECQDILAGISAYLDGDLESAACAVIEKHCQTCTRCTALVTGLKETVGLCRQAGSVPLPEDVRLRARDSVRRLLAEEPARH